MKLSEELMELFCEYHQVPSDLLSYNGPGANASMEDKVSNVKDHVKAVLDVIGSAICSVGGCNNESRYDYGSSNCGRP
jgi:hypothetical protein